MIYQMKLLELLIGLPSMSIEDAVKGISDNRDSLKWLAKSFEELQNSYPNFEEIRIKDIPSLQRIFEEMYRNL